jgi:hypothetical protein
MMKPNYKKVMILLGLIVGVGVGVGVLLYYKYFTVTEGLEDIDEEFLEETEKYITKIKKIIDKKARELIVSIDEYLKNNKNNKKNKKNMMEMNTALNTVFSQYNPKGMSNLSDLQDAIIKIPDSDTDTSVKYIKDKAMYIVRKLAMINNFNFNPHA